MDLRDDTPELATVPRGVVTRRLCAALLLVVLVVLGIAAQPAGAVSQFGSYGTGAGQFIEPNGIAVDQQSGDVYVLDVNNARIERFSGEGDFLRAWGWGVADGRTAALQTCTATTGCFAGLRGSGAGQFGFAEGVAVDNDPRSASQHDVYAVDISNARVEKFSPSGRFLLMFGGQVNETAHVRGETSREDVCPVEPGDRCRSGVAGTGAGRFAFTVEGSFISVGPTGTVYVGDRDRVQEFSPDGVYESQVTLRPSLNGEGEIGGTIALAVDPTGDFYVIRMGVSGVQKYTPYGELLQTLNEEYEPEHIEGPTPNMALGASGRVFLDYLANGQHSLLEYEPSGVELPGFDSGMEDGLHGLAYSDVTGRLYILNTNNGLTPPRDRVRILAPPQQVSPVFSSFSILAWLLAR